MTVGALRPREAARYLSVGLGWLRNSEVRKTFLPGRGHKRPITVYRIADLDAYLAAHAETERVVTKRAS